LCFFVEYTQDDKKCLEAGEDAFLETKEKYEWYPSEPIPQYVSNPESNDFKNKYIELTQDISEKIGKLIH
jgi:hypothetical protein